MKFTYNKSEKLKSEKQIGELFSNGKSISAYPLRLVYIESSFSDGISIKSGVSVPKRNFKKAVDRIKIKRLMREAYRLNKYELFNNITTQYAFMILYIGKEKTSFSEIDIAIKQLFEKFLKTNK
ncbi:ribonuclease P protein component [Lacinutrix iliipiscaria]|uniref:Ribonuclease P protein component n=1 Tax=Lacinutrix iliipiscaria TaxID=1230532 RepID=A0ABW5WJY5_9FLAO